MSEEPPFELVRQARRERECSRLHRADCECDVCMFGDPEPEESMKTEEETLWAVHTIGPDEIQAAPSKAEAEARAIALNAYAKAHMESVPNPEYYPHFEAVAIPYPGDPEDHAEEVKRWLECD